MSNLPRFKAAADALAVKFVGSRTFDSRYDVRDDDYPPESELAIDPLTQGSPVIDIEVANFRRKIASLESEIAALQRQVETQSLIIKHLVANQEEEGPTE